MPPRASHRLTVFIPLPCGRGPDALAALRLLPAVTVGGNGAIALEVHGAQRFVANGQGGFRVSCPDRGVTIAGPFAAALQAWREGAERRMLCPCGASHDLADLHFEPPAAFSQEWVQIADAASGELAPDARDVLGDVRVVWRRG